MNLNVSATLNAMKLIVRPSLCLPHHTVSTFNDLPIPLDKVFQERGRRATIKAVVLDKDDCFAYPESSDVLPAYKVKPSRTPDCPWVILPLANYPYAQHHFERLREAYPGRKLLIVSNTAGATTWDRGLKIAAQVEQSTGVSVLPHSVKKPGCGSEIMEYFKQFPETGVTEPSHVAVVGDRLTTDMMLANMLGGWGFWIRDGVVPLGQKSIVSLWV
jgi:phosphatidylglycerophosphatase GEP4